MQLAKMIVGVGLLLAANVGFAQRSPAAQPKTIAKSQEAILVIKQRAEAGHIPAQIALATKLAEYRRPADALVWYRKAADKGSVEGDYFVGNMLLNGEVGGTVEQSVAANPSAGLLHTYRAATNLHPLACRNMSQVLQKGVVARTNLVEAYAWLQLCSDRSPLLVRAELENLALRMRTADLQDGTKLYKQFKNRQWLPLPTPAAAIKVVILPSELKLDGISMGARSPLATINRRTFAEGETALIPLTKGRSVEIKCLKIEEDSVSFIITGETEPRVLRFTEHLAAVVLK